MVSKTVWTLSAVVVVLYTMAPSIFLWSILGTTVPSFQITKSSVMLLAVVCAIMVGMGYSLGRNKPEINEYEKHIESSKCKRHKYVKER